MSLAETDREELLRNPKPGTACAAARDFHFKRSGEHVPIITDGGMSTGGDICKAIACGSDKEKGMNRDKDRPKSTDRGG